MPKGTSRDEKTSNRKNQVCSLSHFSFSVEHVLSCPKGGVPTLRHNDIRDLTASLLTEVCSQVIVEPEMQPVSNPDEYPLAGPTLEILGP